VLSFVFGFFKIKLSNRFIIHKWCGILTLVFSLIHVLLIIYMHLQ
jgi:predicted ferric reductase